MKLGDVVELKSGSPAMTIVGLDDYGRFICVFWNGSNVDVKFASESFPGDAIQVLEIEE